MRKYDSYKDSKTDAFGDIPVDWKVIRMKHLVDSSKYYQIGDGDHGSIKPEMYLFDSGIPYIRVQNLTWNGKLDFNGMVYISDEVQEKNLKSKLIPNDILIAKTGATIGKLAIIPDEIEQANTTSSVGKITVNQSRFNSKYVLFAMMSRQFTDQIWIEASQKSAQPGFNVDDLVLFQIAIPKTLEEQIAIADYLDRKTAEIDELIADKKRLLELYEEEKAAIINQAVTKGINPDVPMKDSGIEWLGEIPEHWEVLPIKYTLSTPITDGPHETPELLPDGIPFISAEAIKNDKIDFNKKRGFISREEHERFSLKYKPQIGDVYMIKSGATTGNLAIVETDIEFNIWSPLAAMRPNYDVLLSEFLFYFMKSKSFFAAIEIGWNYGTQQNIGMKVLENIRMVLPTINEQKQIVEHIKVQLTLLNSQIEKVNKLIDLLTEYRTVLISEVVTGKIKVTL